MLRCNRHLKLPQIAFSLQELQNWTMGGRKIHECYGVLETIARIWRVSSIFPFTLKYPTGVKKYTIDKFYALYTIFMCILCIITKFYEIINFNKSFRDNSLSIGAVIVLVRTSSSVVCMNLTGIWRIIRHKKLTAAIAKMAEQDLILQKIGCHLKYNSCARMIRAYVGAILVIVIIFVAYHFCEFFHDHERIPIDRVFWTVSLIAQTMNLTIFVSLVASLGVQLSALNEKIEIIAIRANAHGPKMILSKDACAENLRLVAKLHNNICGVGKQINNFFKCEVTINVITAFAILTKTLYWIFNEFQHEGKMDYIRIGAFIHWEFIHSMPIIALVVICNWTSSQASRAGKLVHEIRVEKIDSQLYEAVKSFSLQLHHQKLEFTAGGFFPLNSTLLQSDKRITTGSICHHHRTRIELTCIIQRAITLFNALQVIFFYQSNCRLSVVQTKRKSIKILEVFRNNNPGESTNCRQTPFNNDIPVSKQVMVCKRGSILQGDMFDHLESQKSWTIADKKSRIHDCYGVLDKSTWIWRVFALFPFTVQYQMGVKYYKISKIVGIYTVVMCTVCVLNIFHNLIHFQAKLSPEKITMTVTTIIIRSASGILCMIVASVVRVFRHKELTEFMKLVTMQETFLERMGCRFNRRRQAKTIFAYVLTSFLIILWLMIYDYYSAKHVLGIMKWLLWVMPLMGQVINLTIFVSMVALLGFQFRGLNEKIRIIVTRANASPPKVIVTSDVCAENLRLAAKAHYNICAVGSRINSFFFWDLVINVITAFVILSSTLYYIFVEVQREGETNTVRIGTYIHWELIHSVPIIIIVVVCNWTTHQSNYAGKFIHEIRVQKIDSRLYEAIKTFSLQLHHQKLEFTGGGFFPLNSTLLQAMVGNITTYLVILIQFHPSLDY